MLCERCLNCQWTHGHFAVCQLVYTQVSVSIVMQHEKESHVVRSSEQNDIQVRRTFREIIEPQVNEGAVSILNQWLVSELDIDDLPNDIPRLWK